jgi:diguanylate cyclase (GGDEF)-like protein/PAS domain S-box-containing protein
MEMPGRRLTMSAQLAEMLGKTEAEANAGMDLLDFYADRHRALMATHIDACLGTGLPFDEEAQIVSSSGALMWARSMGQPLVGADGCVRKIYGVMQDLTGKKSSEEAARLITMRLSTTLASISDAFATLDREGRFGYLNRETERLLGHRSGDVLGQEIWKALDDHGSGRTLREIRSALDTGQSVEFEEFYATIGRWLEVRAYPFEEGLAVYFRDVSERRRSQEQLLLLQTSISRLNDIVMITEVGLTDGPGPRIVFVNDAFERQTGYSRDEVLGKTSGILQGRQTQPSELARIRTAMQAAQPVRAELINYKKNGEAFWLEMEIVPVDYFGRGLTHWVAVARDITARKASEDEIEHLAFYDALTQLPNRQLLMDRLENALSGDEGKGQTGALMFIDLDHFKILNDTLGHSKGDLLLQKVALRLSSCVRFSDTVARLGGDEFVVMLEDLGDDPEVAQERTRVVGHKILAALSEPYDLTGYQHHSTCSIGITSFSRHREKIGDLLKQADLAMYQAKAAGRNTVCFFDPAMQAMATANAALNSELREALREQQFLLHYQPQIDGGGKMMGAEALVRWNHPRRGMVAPDEFIAQAEESALILPLGEWVMKTACAQLAEWAKRPETAGLCIAVNVSVRQFRHPEFVDLVMNVITEAGIPANRLKLELTESLLATGMEVTVAKMGLLKRAGVTLSLDDFGMGYSALSYLKHLPLDQLKIDRGFVKDVLTDPNDAAIARTIIGLAQSLGLAVLAEGVETEAQRALLERFGCDFFQGYLFSRPLPIDELESYMEGIALETVYGGGWPARPEH